MYIIELHCHKNNLNLRIKTQPIRLDQMQWFMSDICKQKLYIYCCILPSCDRFGFYVEIQIIFVTVHVHKYANICFALIVL